MNIEEILLSTVNEIDRKLDAFITKSNEDILKRQEDHGKEHSKIWTEIAKLQLKSGFWGIIGGLLVLVPSLLVGWIAGLFKR